MLSLCLQFIWQKRNFKKQIREMTKDGTIDLVSASFLFRIVSVARDKDNCLMIPFVINCILKLQVSLWHYFITWLCIWCIDLLSKCTTLYTNVMKKSLHGCKSWKNIFVLCPFLLLTICYPYICALFIKPSLCQIFCSKFIVYIEKAGINQWLSSAINATPWLITFSAWGLVPQA